MATPLSEVRGSSGKKVPPGLRLRRRLGRIVRAAFLTVVLAGLLVALVQIYRPASLQGLQADPGNQTPVRDLLAELRRASSWPGEDLVISQDELNRYLAATLRGEMVDQAAAQGDLPGSPVRTMIRLRPGACDIYLELELEPKRFTLMLSCQIEQVDGGYKVRMHHGKFGRLPVYGGLLLPGLPAFRSLRESFAPELEALFRMGGIVLEEGELRLLSPAAAAGRVEGAEEPGDGDSPP